MLTWRVLRCRCEADAPVFSSEVLPNGTDETEGRDHQVSSFALSISLCFSPFPSFCRASCLYVCPSLLLSLSLSSVSISLSLSLSLHHDQMSALFVFLYLSLCLSHCPLVCSTLLCLSLSISGCVLPSLACLLCHCLSVSPFPPHSSLSLSCLTLPLSLFLFLSVLSVSYLLCHCFFLSTSLLSLFICVCLFLSLSLSFLFSSLSHRSFYVTRPTGVISV